MMIRALEIIGLIAGLVIIVKYAGEWIVNCVLAIACLAVLVLAGVLLIIGYAMKGVVFGYRFVTGKL